MKKDKIQIAKAKSIQPINKLLQFRDSNSQLQKKNKQKTEYKKENLNLLNKKIKQESRPTCFKNIIVREKSQSEISEIKVKKNKENNKFKQKKKQEKGQFTILLEKNNNSKLDSAQSHKTLCKNKRTRLVNIIQQKQNQDVYCQQQLDNTRNFISNNINPINYIFDSPKIILSFNQEMEAANRQAEIDKFNYLSKREIYYLPDPYYIEKKQIKINWKARAVIINWIMGIMVELRSKRQVRENNQTFHLTIALLDKYLSVCQIITKEYLQLIGTTLMQFLSQKEVKPCFLTDFSQLSGIRIYQIIKMEKQIFKELRWEINPPTIFMWANRLMAQWDSFLEEQNLDCHPLIKDKNVLFKKAEQSSYKNFRQMMQLIDCSILNVQSLQYQPRVLVASFLYLILSKLA